VFNPHNQSSACEMSKNVIELPPNYGLNYLDLAVREFGRIGSLILKGIFHSFDVFDRLNVRSVLDSYGVSRSYKSRVMTISSQSHVAVCKLYHDESVLISVNPNSTSLSTCNFTITMSHKISCIRFLNIPNILGSASLLVIGTTSGLIEVNKISGCEAKVLYRTKLGGSNYPVGMTGGNSSRFQIVLALGKCFLDFDLVSVVSGNVAESTPLVVDLVHPGHIVDCDSFGSIIASISSDGRIVVTDIDSGSYVSFNTVHANPKRLLWNHDNGHLLVGDNDGKLLDYSWSNG
jgi:hypothetical protein